MAKSQEKIQLDNLAKPFIERFDHLYNSAERKSYEERWRQVNTYVLPFELNFDETLQVSTNRTLKRKNYILDNTASISLERLSSAFSGLLTNPAQEWFGIGVEGEEKEEVDEDLQLVLQNIATQMLDYMTSKDVNIYSHLDIAYLCLPSLGTSVLYIDDSVDPLLIRSFSIKDVVIDQNVHGVIDTVYRRETITYRQALQRWAHLPPEEISPKFENMTDLMGKQDEGLEILHIIVPASDYRLIEKQTEFYSLPDRLKRRLRQLLIAFQTGYIVLWINKTDGTIIDMGGQVVNPYIVSRWRLTEKSSLYGYSPAMSALPNIRMVNKMMQTTLRGAEKQVDPPLVLPHGELISYPAVWPGAINFTNGQVTPQPLVPPNAIRTDVGIGIIENTQESIRETFYTSIIQIPDYTDKTAYEVAQRVDEQQRALTPMMLRIQEELINPLIHRVFYILYNKGLLDFSDLPPDFDVNTITFEYENPVVKTHRRREAAGVARAIAELQPWAQIDPEIMDNFNKDKVTRFIPRAYDVPLEIFNNEHEVEAIRTRRRQAEQQAVIQDQRLKAAEAFEKVQGAQADNVRAEAALRNAT